MPVRKMKLFLGISLWLFTSSVPVPVEEDRTAVDPEYLDTLLREGKDDDFYELVGFDSVEFSRSATDKQHGDIVLTEEQRGATKRKVGARHTLNFNVFPVLKWENSVPYYINPSFSPQQRRRVLSAITEFNRSVGKCIKWVPRQTEEDYVYIFPGFGCHSALGRIGKQQGLSLNEYVCMEKGTILHEMNHAIGFLHEHMRPDRDKYILMLWDNIKEGWKPDYQKAETLSVRLTGAYDYYSIMHYPQTSQAAVSDDLPTFYVRNRAVNVKRIGAGQSFTPQDKRKIVRTYCRPVRPQVI